MSASSITMSPAWGTVPHTHLRNPLKLVRFLLEGQAVASEVKANKLREAGPRYHRQGTRGAFEAVAR